MKYKDVIIEKRDVHFTFTNPVMCIRNFDSSKPCGWANIQIKEGIMVADMDLVGGLDEFFPAIAYRYGSLKGATTTDTRRGHIYAIGICNGVNVDESIKRLKHFKQSQPS